MPWDDGIEGNVLEFAQTDDSPFYKYIVGSNRTTINVTSLKNK